MLVGDVRCATVRSGADLHVVRREGVILGADERVEVPPRLPRDLDGGTRGPAGVSGGAAAASGD